MDMQKIERIHPFCIFLDFSASESGSATMAGATGVRGAFQGLGGKNWIGSYPPFGKKLATHDIVVSKAFFTHWWLESKDADL